MQPQTVTLIVAGLGIGGTLTSGIVSQVLNRKSQHTQWLRDCRKEEFKELLTELTSCFGLVSRIGLRLGLSSHEEHESLVQAEESAKCVINNRIYIRRTVVKMHVAEKWERIITMAKNHFASSEAHKLFHELNREISHAAIDSAEHSD